MDLNYVVLSFLRDCSCKNPQVCRNLCIVWILSGCYLRNLAIYVPFYVKPFGGFP